MIIKVNKTDQQQLKPGQILTMGIDLYRVLTMTDDQQNWVYTAVKVGEVQIPLNLG